MPEIDTLVLPLLPLTTGVVLPGMVVTLTIESDEARAAAEAAAATDDRRCCCSCPRSTGATRASAPSPRSRTSARPADGVEALVIRGLLARRRRGRRSRHRRGRCGSRSSPCDGERAHRARPRARPGVPGRDREHRRGARRAAGGRVPARHRRPGADRRHRRLLARPVLRAEGRGAGDDRRRGAPRAGRSAGRRRRSPSSS